MSSVPEGLRGPVLLCYDGSDPARQAIERAGRVLGGGKAVVLTVWESVGSAILGACRRPVLRALAETPACCLRARAPVGSLQSATHRSLALER
jgi:hypothetical protein